MTPLRDLSRTSLRATSERAIFLLSFSKLSCASLQFLRTLIQAYDTSLRDSCFTGKMWLQYFLRISLSQGKLSHSGLGSNYELYFYKNLFIPYRTALHLHRSSKVFLKCINNSFFISSRPNLPKLMLSVH